MLGRCLLVHIDDTFFGCREGLKHYDLLLLLVRFSHWTAKVIIIDFILIF
jgi:hypothetical protein